ncbi:MAG: hypothetical protein NDJ75_05410, partial [Thermoanaerobaculia bacterium]|nr:hypothetical protein [Thermoanaerobaculia bacterium]
MSDRKYKQQGYKSSGEAAGAPPRPPQTRPAAAPAERGERPRGRGLGAPTAEVFRCARCGAAATVAAAAALAARCEACGNDLHTCSNCAHFDTGARFECRREVPQRVTPKDRANRCELFEPRLRHEFAQEKRAEPRDA